MASLEELIPGAESKIIHTPVLGTNEYLYITTDSGCVLGASSEKLSPCVPGTIEAEFMGAASGMACKVINSAGHVLFTFSPVHVSYSTRLKIRVTLS